MNTQADLRKNRDSNHAEMSDELSRSGLMKLAGAAMIGTTAFGLDGCKKQPTNQSNGEEAATQDDIVVDDFAYYRAVESAIRDEMKKFETGIVLPLAETAVKDGGFESRVDREQPVEGYYHETPELKEVFFLIRTLQSNFTAKKTRAIIELHNIYDPKRHPVFGLRQACPTSINPADVLSPGTQAVTISPVVDPVSQASSEVVRKTGGPNWTIDNIMNNIDKACLGTSFVRLGRRFAGKWN